VGYTDDENDFVFAKSDLELSEAYRLSKGSNEVKLYIKTSLNTPVLSDIEPVTLGKSNDTDEAIKFFDKSMEHLTTLISEASTVKQNFLLASEAQRLKQREMEQQFEQLIETERAKASSLEEQLMQTKDSLAFYNAENSTCKESLNKMAAQFQLKIKEISELRKDREQKIILETKLVKLEKDLNTKIEENLSMSRTIHSVTIERDHFSKKAAELESRQQTFESDLIRSFQMPLTNGNTGNNIIHNTSTPVSSPNTTVVVPLPVPLVAENNPFVPSLPNPSTSNSSSIGISLPDDIDEVDIQILLSMGFSLEEDPQRIFDLIRQKRDVSQVIEELLSK
jgi:replicative DNA helicase